MDAVGDSELIEDGRSSVYRTELESEANDIGLGEFLPFIRDVLIQPNLTVFYPGYLFGYEIGIKL